MSRLKTVGLVTAGLVFLMFGTHAYAETVYVKERQATSLRAGPTATDDVVAQAVSGTGMELVEQTDTFTKVRVADGTEGWLANALVTRKKPSAMRILSAETRLKQANIESKKLKKAVQALKAKLKNQDSEQPEPAQQSPDTADGDGSSFFEFGILAWLGISFAMLITGFVAGVIWLRERTRRKLGGMHIRVS